MDWEVAVKQDRALILCFGEIGFVSKFKQNLDIGKKHNTSDRRNNNFLFIFQPDYSIMLKVIKYRRLAV